MKEGETIDVPARYEDEAIERLWGKLMELATAERNPLEMSLIMCAMALITELRNGKRKLDSLRGFRLQLDPSGTRTWEKAVTQFVRVRDWMNGLAGELAAASQQVDRVAAMMFEKKGR